MNPDKTKEYQLLQSIINLLDQTSIETRKRLAGKLSNYDLSTDPIGIITERLKEMQLDTYKELDALLNEGETITDDLKSGKSFVTAMSSQARVDDEKILQRRTERYQQMLDETEEVVSPSSRLHN